MINNAAGAISVIAIINKFLFINIMIDVCNS